MSELFTRTSIGQLPSRPADITLAQFGLPSPLLGLTDNTGGPSTIGQPSPSPTPNPIAPSTGGLGSLSPVELEAIMDRVGGRVGDRGFFGNRVPRFL